MQTAFTIKRIEHNGRKAARGTEKSSDIVGYGCSFDWKAIEQFKPIRLKIYSHPSYDFWDMTEVLEAYWMTDEETGNEILVIETTNSIYYFEPLEAMDEEKLAQECREFALAKAIAKGGLSYVLE